MNDTTDDYDVSDIKDAVMEVLDTYTYFEDAYDKMALWSGPEGILQNRIANQYTTAIPTIMRKVR